MNKKIAIVYDWMDSWGGVERILLLLHREFPQAHFYTSYIDLDRAPWAKGLTVYTSFIQKMPAFIRSNRILSLFFYPYAFESFDFSPYDVVISVSSSFSKGVITKPQTRHVCYLLTPPRYLWGMSEVYIKNKFKRVLLSPVLAALRTVDYLASKRPDVILSLSQTVASRCRTYYGLRSHVVNPPFDTNHWNQIKKKLDTTDSKLTEIDQVITLPFYLIIARLEPYKKVDLVIDVFNENKQNLVIVGTGTLMKKLKQKAQKNITFINNLSDLEIASLYRRAQALIMPQEEDFGYTALEAQFFGCPVLAYRQGGATETISELYGSVFFDEQTAKSIQDALTKHASGLERSGSVAYNVHINTGLSEGIFAQYSNELFLRTLRSYIK